MVFVWLGRVGFVCLAVAGLLSTFALDLLTVVRCINVAVAIGAVSLVRERRKRETLYGTGESCASIRVDVGAQQGRMIERRVA